MDPWEDQEDYDKDVPASETTSTSHKKLFVTIAIVLGLIIVSTVIAITFTRVAIRQSAQERPDDPRLRIERPGYVNVPEGIGDPAALTQQETNSPVTYQGIAVVDACSLLKIDTIREQDLLIAPGAESGAMTRHFFDGTSTTVITDWQESEELTKEINNCNYVLVDSEGKRNGSLAVEVFQPAYAGAQALRNTLDDYLLRGEIVGGVQIYDRTNTPIQDTRTFYFLEKDGNYAGVELNLGDKENEETTRILLETIARHFNSILEAPQGPAAYSYDSPTFDGTYTSACDITSADDVEILFDLPAIPSSQERIATATGIISRGNEQSNYISNQCVRRTSNNENGQSSTLTIGTNSYETEAGAAAFLAEERKDPTIDVEQRVGDETFFTTAGDSENTLFFRSGTTVVSLRIYEPNGESMDSSERAERLTPVAEKILQRMNGEEGEYEELSFVRR